MVYDNGTVAGLYVFSDVKRIKTRSSSYYNIDKNGQLRVGAAVGVGKDALIRLERLLEKNVDLIVIDTAHGDSRPVLKTLKEIKKKTKIPLVLHGASGIPKNIVKEAEKYGAKLKGVHGVPDSQVRLAVRNGINKVNTDTDLRLAFDAAVRKVIAKKPKDFDPRHILGPAREHIQKVVEQRIKLFGSGGKG